HCLAGWARPAAGTARQGSGLTSSNSFSPCHRERGCIAASPRQRCKARSRKCCADTVQWWRAGNGRRATVACRRRLAVRARQSCSPFRFQHFGKSGLPRGATLKADLSECADQGVRECEIAFPVVLPPALLTRNNALVQQKAVQHEPSAPVYEDQLRR